MKNFVYKLGCFLAIQVAILGFVTTYGSMDSSTNEYMYSLKDKYDLLLETPSPRIIFIGGSNLAFGLKSGQLKQETGLNPINMGVHGRLGIGCMIRMVSENLRTDDIVVVSPEYSAMFRAPECSQELAVEAFRVWPESRRFLQPEIEEQLDSLVPRTTPLRSLGQCVTRARLRLKESGSTNSAGNKLECYRRSSFNRFGDHVAHYQATPTYHENGKLLEMNDDVFAQVAGQLNEFALVCRQNDAKIYFLHPPITATKIANHVDQAQHIEQLMATMLEFPSLTNLDMATFADGLFFDGQSHLNEQGARLRADIVCRQIKEIERIAAETSASSIR